MTDEQEKRMNARFDAVDQRFDAVDQRFDHLDEKIERIITTLLAPEERPAIRKANSR